ncbi:molybdenum cofactor guanylyltransferase [Microbacterium sp. 18062]|uniref:molybdenum cofactor guanylyltransferase n=1 Tax=Microbacterium sp. 18062 TaxID=2681410 RepID=UPI00135BA97A|nr:NTP transferase domain-containing protein [Microbacterium sp. 18062]
MTPSLGAILLAGGRATRLDGTAKPLLVLGGSSILARTLAAVRAAGAASVVVAGPPAAGHDDLTWVREDPPFSGPAAAVVAALGATAPAADPDWTLVLACDLVRPDAAVPRLVADLLLLPADTEGLCLADETSRPQWLTGVYRTAALRRAAGALAHGGRDAPVRALLDDLSIAVVRVPDDVVRDIDTWEDLEDARRRVEPGADGIAKEGSP